MKGTRRSGILLHPTSLPGPWGIGDLGPAAIAFLDWLRDAGQTIWQILPLGPTGHGNSPYTASSAFAANPMLISPQLLSEAELLPADWQAEDEPPGRGRVDYPRVIEWKDRLLRRSWEHLSGSSRATEVETAIRAFAERSETRPWLGDWCLFAALKRRYDGASWRDWPAEYRAREDAALQTARVELADEIAYQEYLQYLAFDQWRRVREAAAERDIAILGDLPIYVGDDSADVWANRELFDLDSEGNPLSVAGVPPDDFSDTGQLWGNPLYRWDRLAESGFRWWIDRMRASLAIADRLRLDHFRGFAGYWSVPADAETAAEGEWIEGPGLALFEALDRELGDLPLVAEDLGVITDDVHELRHALGIPAMRVLQFGFGESHSIHLPHNLATDCVLYTGTHDNSTFVAWYAAVDEELRTQVELYTGGPPDEVHWAAIRTALTSVAESVVMPIQDVLGLDDSARMNLPGNPSGNWEWRLSEVPGAPEASRLRALVELSDRLPSDPDPDEVRSGS